jgi:hypothetical protein
MHAILYRMNDNENTEKRAEKEEQYRVAVTQGDIREIKRDVTNLAQKVDDIHIAFVGSKLAEDGGIVKTIKDLKEEVRQNRADIDELTLKLSQRIYQTKIMWGIGGAIVLAIFTIILQVIFKK